MNKKERGKCQRDIKDTVAMQEDVPFSVIRIIKRKLDRGDFLFM